MMMSKLPTREEVLSDCFQERVVLYSETGNAIVDFLHIANKIAHKVKAIYDRASISTVTEYRTIQLIITYNDSCRKLRKSSNRKINK